MEIPTADKARSRIAETTALQIRQQVGEAIEIGIQNHNPHAVLTLDFPEEEYMSIYQELKEKGYDVKFIYFKREHTTRMTISWAKEITGSPKEAEI